MAKKQNSKPKSTGETIFNQPIREHGSIESNPVGLSKKSCQKLAGDLDRHLASYNVLYNQYHKHHWLVMGPQFRDLHLFLEEHYQQVHAHLDEIAERMTVLGAIPTCTPTAQEKLAYVEHEPEGQFRIRHMLERDLQAERSVCIQLRASVATAAEEGDFGTKSLLERFLLHAEDRAHHIEHFLEADSLELGVTAREEDVREDPVLDALGKR
ncbi:DNA starvation/stationary phase protection protein DpsA [soil metagenome]